MTLPAWTTRAAGAIALVLVSIGTAMAQSGQPYFDEAAKALERNNITAAKEKLLQGLKVEPDHANAMVNLANIYLIEKNHPEATKWFDRALKLDPTNAIGLNGRGLLYLQAGNLDKAVDAFVAATKSDPTNPTPVLNLGDLAIRAGDSINAIRYYDLVLQIDPDNERANAMMGELHAVAGLGDKAIAYAQRALAKNPKNYVAMSAMGKGHGAKGEWLRAVDYLYDAAKGMPGDATAQYALGIALLNTRQYRPAAESFLAALDIDDTDPKIHLQLGIAYYMTKDKQLVSWAQKEFNHVFERKPSPEDRASAYYHLALIEDDAGNSAKAIEIYGNALKHNARHVGAANNAGLLLAASGKFTEAIPYYQRSLKANPSFTAARFNLGYAYLQLGNKKEARAELLKLMTLPDDDPFKMQAKQLLNGTN